MSFKAVKKRRTTFDERNAMERHRRYGWDAPCCDIDCLEYDKGIPKAIIEYKFHKAKIVDLDHLHPTTKAKRHLADAANLPFFVVRYWEEMWTYFVRPANDIAAAKIGKERLVSEELYVRFLYLLRGRRLSDDLDLHTTKDPVAERWVQRHFGS
jgi:hypothetical protein